MYRKETNQKKFWLSNFGKEYLKRNPHTPYELDNSYKIKYGVTRSQLNKTFIGNLRKDLRILEVGASFGNQLWLLKKMGFLNLYGIELDQNAIRHSIKNIDGITIIQGDALNVPFKDGYFDLVFTSGLLIHINPRNIVKAVSEIYRCSNKYIWGFEYYSEIYSRINYRGHSNVLWKANFEEIYQQAFPSLKLLKHRIINYLDDLDNKDLIFLFKKQ